MAELARKKVAMDLLGWRRLWVLRVLKTRRQRPEKTGELREPGLTAGGSQICVLLV